MLQAVQIWNPDDWEVFSLSLLQSRHGALNIQKIPAAHKGDFGIDYYSCKDGVVYQCYAVDEPVDIATRADRQKTKITRDLAKLLSNHLEISKLLLGEPIKHWVLLSPLHDSREVNLHCATKTQDMRKSNCPALHASFEVVINDKTSFPAADVHGSLSALSQVRLSVPAPSQQDLDGWAAGSVELLTNANKKLLKKNPQNIQNAVSMVVRTFLEGNALLDALRNGSPDMHEKVVAAVGSRARRLEYIGTSSDHPPALIMDSEFGALVEALNEAAPSLSKDNAEQIAYASISDWILRCPLDFPDAN